MQQTKNIIIALLGIVIFFTCLPTHAAKFKPSVAWSGVGFSGNWNDREINYPFTSQFFCLQNCTKDNSVEMWARERMIQTDTLRETGFELHLGLIDDKAIEKIGLAIAISNESIVFEKLKIGNKVSFLTNYSITGSALFFDLASKKLIYSVPLITRYTTVYDTLPEASVQKETLRSMLQNNSLGINFFDEMTTRLGDVDFKTSPTAYLKITDARFSEEAQDQFSKEFNIALAQQFLATFYESVFIRETGYALIPNSIGHAVGNKIATRLPSGDLTIELPEPGYSMTVNVAKLLYQRKKGKGSDSFCWGARVEWRLEELVFGKETIGAVDLKNVNCAVAGQDSILSNDSEYMKLVMSMLEKYAMQFKKQEPEWIKKYTDNPKNTSLAIKKLHQIFAY
ncbi:hypothetical protein E0Z06_13865 [Rheinheimera sp. D18]|uniref:hypothetical protein n=1 Tax=Rheinheimera sp. D18 TaxID=2545632 RepID=UPI00104C8C7E|nr:hypothetical protein [Rheinheimera sp. D18]QBL10535.1 hypothetical protein E0Z06_13865 [Rheinheimera sp. D18]